MSVPAIRTVAAADAERAVAVLVLAFSADVATRWAFPEPSQYLAHFPAFVRAFGGRAFEHGTAYCAEDYGGAALWLPPGVQPDEDALGALFQRGVAEQTRGDLFAVLEQMASYHPTEPHWYLPLIGVDPTRQGKGCGSALLKHALARCDRDGRLAYLESSNPANIPLYERHGFEVAGTIQAGSSPPFWPMLRQPR
jgi:ribosomal protein S18 acetylase RimI-like enzyme